MTDLKKEAAKEIRKALKEDMVKTRSFLNKINVISIEIESVMQEIDKEFEKFSSDVDAYKVSRLNQRGKELCEKRDTMLEDFLK